MRIFALSNSGSGWQGSRGGLRLPAGRRGRRGPRGVAGDRSVHSDDDARREGARVERQHLGADGRGRGIGGCFEQVHNLHLWIFSHRYMSNQSPVFVSSVTSHSVISHSVISNSVKSNFSILSKSTSPSCPPRGDEKDA